MKKLYIAPEIEFYEMEPFCQDEESGQVVPTGHDGRIFDRSEVGNDDNSNSVWDN